MKKIKILCTALLVLTGMQNAKAQQPITFEKYLLEVANNNLEYLSQQHNVKIADAEIAIQNMFPDPELAFEAVNETFSLELGYTLELGKRKNRVNLAKTQAEMETLALEWFFSELRAEAANAYLNAILQRELLEVKRNSYKYMAQLSEYDSLRYKAGEISENDARQTFLEAATLLNEVYNQEGEYKSAIIMLNQYMGNNSGELFNPLGGWDNIDNRYDLNELVAYGMEHRVDLLMANKSIDMALQNIRTVKAERRPDIGVIVGYERNWNGLFPVRQNMLKAGIAIPLKFSNLNKGSIRQSEHILKQNETQAQHTALQVQTDISQAYFRYESLGRQVEEYKSGLLNEAHTLLEGMTFRYKRGEINILELLVAQRTHNEVREQYLETMKEYAVSLVFLQKSAGMWDVGF